MIFYITELLHFQGNEDLTELLGLDTWIIAPFFMVLGIICMICWLKDRADKKNKGDK